MSSRTMHFCIRFAQLNHCVGVCDRVTIEQVLVKRKEKKIKTMISEFQDADHDFNNSIGE
jgi:hypothetical protein